MMKPTSPTGGKPTASKLYRELRRFFTGLPHELSMDPAALVATSRQHASHHLLGAGFDPRSEISMYLLTSYFMNTDQEQEQSWLHRLMLTAPEYRPWRAYLSRFPPGDDCAGFRVQRIGTLDVLLPRAHPDLESKRGYALAPDHMLPEIRRFVSEHIQGPYVCTRCQAEVEALRLSAGLEVELIPLAAAGAEDLEFAIELEGDAGPARLIVRCLDDRGYLRIFVRALDDDAITPAADYSIAIDFDDGYQLTSRMKHPSDAYAGCNAGHLGERTLGNVSGLRILTEPH